MQYCSIKRRRFFLGLLSAAAFSLPSLLSLLSVFSPPKSLPKNGNAGAVPKSKVSSFSSASSFSFSSLSDIRSINWSLICSISSSDIFIRLSISSTGFMPSSLAHTRQRPCGSEPGVDASARKTTAGRFLHLEQSFILYLRLIKRI